MKVGNVNSSSFAILKLKEYARLFKIRVKYYIFFDDEKYLKRNFLKKMNCNLDLKKPKTFNEKLQYLKINNKNDYYSKLVDKFEVREYVKEKIGDKYLNELYRTYSSVNDINIDELPEKFVLKTTHDSGGVIICKNKSDVNWKNELFKFKIRMKINYYYLSREYYYKNVVPRIICEKLLESQGGDVWDYKVFCFNGKADFVQVDVDRFRGHKRNFYNCDWELQEFTMEYKRSDIDIPRPSNLDEMIECAEKLAEGIKFCRVDFYSIDERIIFGEITFFPEAGHGEFQPQKYDKIIGNKLVL